MGRVGDHGGAGLLYRINSLDWLVSLAERVEASLGVHLSLIHI